jgi:tetratricopeptide (TPR) repeat protein
MVCLAQPNNLDILRSRLALEKTDTGRVNVLMACLDSVNLSEPIFAYYVCMHAIDLAERSGWGRGMSDGYSWMGNLSYRLAKTEESEKYYLKAEEVEKKLGDMSRLGVIYDGLGSIYENLSRTKEAMDVFHKSLKAMEEAKDIGGIANCLQNIAMRFKADGDLTKAIEYSLKTISIYEKNGIHDHLLGQAYNGAGLIYQHQGNIDKALEYYSKALKTDESSKDLSGMMTSYSNIGAIYQIEGETEKALEYFAKSYELSKQSGDIYGMATYYNNVGYIYDRKANYEKAAEFYNKAMELYRKLEYKSGEANALNNLGVITQYSGNDKKALEYYNKSIALKESIGDKLGIARTYNLIGYNFYKHKKYAKALEYSERSLEAGKRSGYIEITKSAASNLVFVYKAIGNYTKALENFELYIKMRDSVNNENNKKASIRSQLKYEYEKQSAADSVAHAKESEIKNAELKRQTAEIKAKKNQQYALFGGLALVGLFSVFMYNRFKITQRQKLVIESQKSEVEEQKKLVEEKQKEILDSIYYARRIQLAQIPNEKQVSKFMEISGKK